jgi:hypothetical protein
MNSGCRLAMTIAMLATTPLMASHSAEACRTPCPQDDHGWVLNRPNYPVGGVPLVPTNALFVIRFNPNGSWRLADGTPIVLDDDARLSALFGTRVARPHTGSLPPGAQLFAADDPECGPGPGTCADSVTVAAGPDTTPPSRASLRSVRIEWPDSEIGSCAMDRLVLQVDGTDDTTRYTEMAIAVFIGNDESSVERATEPAIVLGFDEATGTPLQGRLDTSTVWLGRSSNRARDGEPLRAAGRFCFTVSLMDWAGNIGERSEATCLDTTDAHDPRLVHVQPALYPRPCGCVVASGGVPRESPAIPAPLATVVLLGFAATTHRRRQAARFS